MLKNKITKKDLIKSVNIKTGVSYNFSKKIINDLVEIILNNIKDGKVKLKGIGTFQTIEKKERIGRNPKTKETFIITARKSISFKSSKKILDNLNK